MSTVGDQFVGLGEETVFGTAVAPTRFFEFAEEGIEGKYERIESESIRAGMRTLHKDRFAANAKGAEGDLELEVLDKGFGVLFRHMLGSGALGTVAGGFTPQTFQLGPLDGKSLCAQVARVDNDGSLVPFTFSGGKINEWELSCEVDAILKLTLSLDFATETPGPGAGALALATPTYPVGSLLFTYVGGSVLIGGTEFAVDDVSIKGNNALKTDRYFIKTGTSKKEQKENELREYEFKLSGEFEGVSNYNRFASLVSAQTLATLQATFAAPSGATLVVSAPFARFDEGPVKAERDITKHELTGKLLSDGATGPLTLVYRSTDTAI